MAASYDNCSQTYLPYRVQCRIEIRSRRRIAGPSLLRKEQRFLGPKT